jgi:hypothetical protein
MESSLCDRCRVLEFDDSAWPGSHRAGSDEEGFHLGIKDLGTNAAMHLDYEVFEDSLPDLAVLSRSEQKGCAFCRLLKAGVQRLVSSTALAKTVKVVKLYYNWDYYFGKAEFARFGLVALVAEMELYGAGIYDGGMSCLPFVAHLSFTDCHDQ